MIQILMHWSQFGCWPSVFVCRSNLFGTTFNSHSATLVDKIEFQREHIYRKQNLSYFFLKFIPESSLIYHVAFIGIFAHFIYVFINAIDKGFPSQSGKVLYTFHLSKKMKNIVGCFKSLMRTDCACSCNYIMALVCPSTLSYFI